MDQFIVKLNSAAYLPEKAYRRNSKTYELVCYVNCLLGCRVSGNKEGTNLFKARVEDYIRRNSPESDFEQYFKLVEAFIRLSDDD